MTALNELRLVDYLDHMLDAISRGQRYVAGLDESDFLADEKTQDAVIRTFEVIGEAANNVSKRFPEFAAHHAEIPWGVAIGMRNVLAHGYFKVDLVALWRTIHSDLPGLREKVQVLRTAMAENVPSRT